ncbi:hypothetical protein QUB47_00245 [Microcoleus sp. AT9_B5]
MSKLVRDAPPDREMEPGFLFPLSEIPGLDYVNKPGLCVSFVSIILNN